MIFHHKAFAGQKANSKVPINLITELLSGPTEHFWLSCIKYARLMQQNNNLVEMARVLNITVEAHAYYHLNIPREQAQSLKGPVLVELVNRFEELVKYSGRRIFDEAELAILHHEPNVPCLDPQSDGHSAHEELKRFDPDE